MSRSRLLKAIEADATQAARHFAGKTLGEMKRAEAKENIAQPEWSEIMSTLSIKLHCGGDAARNAELVARAIEEAADNSMWAFSEIESDAQEALHPVARKALRAGAVHFRNKVSEKSAGVDHFFVFAHGGENQKKDAKTLSETLPYWFHNPLWNRHDFRIEALRRLSDRGEIAGIQTVQKKWVFERFLTTRAESSDTDRIKNTLDTLLETSLIGQMELFDFIEGCAFPEVFEDWLGRGVGPLQVAAVMAALDSDRRKELKSTPQFAQTVMGALTAREDLAGGAALAKDWQKAISAVLAAEREQLLANAPIAPPKPTAEKNGDRGTRIWRLRL